MFTKVCVQKGKNVIPLSTLPKVSSFSDLGEGKTGPVTLSKKNALRVFSTSIPGDRIYSHQFAAELEAVGKGAEARQAHLSRK